MPGEAAITVWSLRLDATGNSLARTCALKRFTTLTARSISECAKKTLPF
jgi:glutaminase